MFGLHLHQRVWEKHKQLRYVYTQLTVIPDPYGRITFYNSERAVENKLRGLQQGEYKPSNYLHT